MLKQFYQELIGITILMISMKAYEAIEKEKEDLRLVILL